VLVVRVADAREFEPAARDVVVIPVLLPPLATALAQLVIGHCENGMRGLDQGGVEQAI
jgi:hypothetical protein